MIYFFIPLKIPLRIPDEHIIRFTSPAHPFEEDEKCIGTEWDDELGYTVNITSSIKIHQVQFHKSDTYLEAALNAVNNAFSTDSMMKTEEATKDSSHEDPEITITVLEAATRLTGITDELEDTTTEKSANQVPLQHSEAIQQSITEAFDRIIDDIRNFQRSYVQVTDHLVRLVSPAELPMALPYAIRTVKLNETEPVWPTVVDFFRINLADSYIEQMSFSSADINPDLIDDIIDTGEIINAGPFSDFMDNWRETRLAVRNHSYSIACILASTSCELFLRKVLLLLLWEEGRCPKQAARLLCGNAPYSRSIGDLISREFHDRLGGSWNLRGEGTIPQMYQSVFILRNRVVHGGYVPITSEVEQAVNAFEELYAFIIQRFESKIDQYTVTASMMIPNSKIKNSDLSARLEDLMLEQITPDSPLDNFMSYQFEVERYMENRDLRNGAAFSGELEDAHIALLAFPNGKAQWWLADPESRVACLAKRPHLNRKQIAGIQEVRRDIKRERVLSTGAISMRMYGVHTVPLEDTPVWYPTYQIWPLYRADRFPACPIPVHPS